MQLVRHIISKEKIRTIILCGKDTAGHKAGQSLLCLYQNGIDENGRIIGSASPNPILSLTNRKYGDFKSKLK